MIIYAELVSGRTLTATAATYYTAPTYTQAAIHACSATNPTGAPVTVNLYRVPLGGSAGFQTKIATRVIAAGATSSLIDAINHKLAPGSQIFADGLGCSLNISGIEYIPAN